LQDPIRCPADAEIATREIIDEREVEIAAAVDRLARIPDFRTASFAWAWRPTQWPLPRARDAAPLRPLRFHDLRHTFGSLAVDGGDSLVQVQAWMGHADIGTTMRYLHTKS
jgi:hypothetical protein